jgi:NADPH:quinone reductase-like Zn-dependent oxidoreductase
MTTKAIVYVEKGKAAIQDVPIPKLRDDYILVKVNAVALNPTDWKGVDLGMGEVSSRIGCDYAGVVEEVGPKVTKTFKNGDRIAGMVHGWYSASILVFQRMHANMSLAIAPRLRMEPSPTTLL